MVSFFFVNPRKENLTEEIIIKEIWTKKIKSEDLSEDHIIDQSSKLMCSQFGRFMRCDERNDEELVKTCRIWSWNYLSIIGGASSHSKFFLEFLMKYWIRIYSKIKKKKKICSDSKDFLKLLYISEFRLKSMTEIDIIVFYSFRWIIHSDKIYAIDI